MNVPIRSAWRSLSGHQLEGEKIVRLVYVDEAGISKHEPFVTVAGVIIHADSKLNAVERHLDKLVKRHIPPEQQDGFVFHAKELFNGGGKVFDRKNPYWTNDKKLKIADDLADIIRRFKLPIALGFLDKSKIAETFPHSFPVDGTEQEQAVFLHVSAFMNCAMLAEHWMREHASNEVTMLVVEDNQQAKKLIRDTQRFHQDRRLASLLSDKSAAHFPLRKIKEDPLFQEKRPFSALQVADFVAYVFKKILMGTTFYDRFFDPMRSEIVSFDDAWPARLDRKVARIRARTHQHQARERLL